MKIQFERYDILLLPEYSKHKALLREATPKALRANFDKAIVANLGDKRILQIPLGKSDSNLWVFERTRLGCWLRLKTPPMSVRQMITLEHKIFPKGVPRLLYAKPSALTTMRAARFTGDLMGANLAHDRHWSVGMED